MLFDVSGGDSKGGIADVRCDYAGVRIVLADCHSDTAAASAQIANELSAGAGP
jgi:hypothetical protein